MPKPKGSRRCRVYRCMRWAPCPTHDAECAIPGCPNRAHPEHAPYCGPTGTHCVCVLTGDACLRHTPELVRPSRLRAYDPSSQAVLGPGGGPGRTRPPIFSKA